MENNDYLVKSMTKDGMFRAYAVRATNLVEKAHEIHDTWSASSAALGRTLIGTLLLSTSSLDEKAGMTVKIQGNGPVGYIVADGTAHGEVKGYMKNPHVNLPLNDAGKIDVAGAEKLLQIGLSHLRRRLIAVVGGKGAVGKLLSEIALHLPPGGLGITGSPKEFRPQQQNPERIKEPVPGKGGQNIILRQLGEDPLAVSFQRVAGRQLFVTYLHFRSSVFLK